MNRSEIVRETAKRVGKSIQEIDDIVDVFHDIATEALLAGEIVKIRRWGVFQPRTRKAQSKPNPRSGETMHIPARNTVAFLPSDLLKERLNEA